MRPGTIFVIGCDLSHKSSGGGKDVVELLYGAEGDNIGRLGREGFGADILDLGVKMEGAENFAEEGCLALLGLD